MFNKSFEINCFERKATFKNYYIIILTALESYPKKVHYLAKQFEIRHEPNVLYLKYK